MSLSPRIFPEVRDQVRSGSSPRSESGSRSGGSRSESGSRSSSPKGSPRSTGSPRSPRGSETETVRKSLRRFAFKRQSSESSQMGMEVTKERKESEELSPRITLFSDYKDELLGYCKSENEEGVCQIIDMCTIADLLFVMDSMEFGSIKRGLEVRLEHLRNM